METVLVIDNKVALVNSQFNLVLLPWSAVITQMFITVKQVSTPFFCLKLSRKWLLQAHIESAFTFIVLDCSVSCLIFSLTCRIKFISLP